MPGSKPLRRFLGYRIRICWACNQRGGLLETLRYSVSDSRYFGPRLIPPPDSQNGEDDASSPG